MKSELKVKSIYPNAIALLGMRNRWIVWEDARLSRHLSNTVKRTESAAYVQALREIQTDPELYITGECQVLHPAQVRSRLIRRLDSSVARSIQRSTSIFMFS